MKLNQQPAQQETIKPVKKSKPLFINRGPDGSLEFAPIREDKAQRMTHDQMNKYFDIAFNRVAKDTSYKARFERVFNTTTCLHCRDKGYHVQQMKSPEGKLYDMPFKCLCKPSHADDHEFDDMVSVRELIEMGVFELKCKFGEYSHVLNAWHCLHDARPQRCWSTNCPKFDGDNYRPEIID